MAENKSRAAENAAKSENVPSVAGTESNDSVGEARPQTSDAVTNIENARAPLAVPTFGPGSKVNWDDEKLDPNKRKHMGIDPDGTHNAKAFGGGAPEKD